MSAPANTLDSPCKPCTICDMLLATHLRSKGLTDQKFAALIGCERSFVTRLRNGDANASFKVVQAIERATSGQVTAVDLYEARKARLAVRPPRTKTIKRGKRRPTLQAAE